MRAPPHHFDGKPMTSASPIPMSRTAAATQGYPSHGGYDHATTVPEADCNPYSERERSRPTRPKSTPTTHQFSIEAAMLGVSPPPNGNELVYPQRQSAPAESAGISNGDSWTEPLCASLDETQCTNLPWPLRHRSFDGHAAYGSQEEPHITAYGQVANGRWPPGRSSTRKPRTGTSLIRYGDTRNGNSPSGDRNSSLSRTSPEWNQSTQYSLCERPYLFQGYANIPTYLNGTGHESLWIGYAGEHGFTQGERKTSDLWSTMEAGNQHKAQESRDIAVDKSDAGLNATSNQGDHRWTSAAHFQSCLNTNPDVHEFGPSKARRESVISSKDRGHTKTSHSPANRYHPYDNSHYDHGVKTFPLQGTLNSRQPFPIGITAVPTRSHSRELEEKNDEVLVCPYPHGGKRIEFRGRYRRGNCARHIRQKHGKTEQEYPCEDTNCDKTFKRQDARLKHLRQHHANLVSEPLRRR